MTMAEILLQFAKSVGGFLAAGSNLKRARNQDIGSLLEQMASCLKSIADDLEAGNEPIAQCHELLHYAQVVPRALRRSAGFWNGKSVRLLSGAIDAAVDAPSTAVLALRGRGTVAAQVFGYGDVQRAVSSTFEDELRKLREAQGLLTAAATLVRAGAGWPKAASSSP